MSVGGFSGGPMWKAGPFTRQGTTIFPRGFATADLAIGVDVVVGSERLRVIGTPLAGDSVVRAEVAGNADVASAFEATRTPDADIALGDAICGYTSTPVGRATDAAGSAILGFCALPPATNASPATRAAYGARGTGADIYDVVLSAQDTPCTIGVFATAALLTLNMLIHGKDAVGAGDPGDLVTIRGGDGNAAAGRNLRLRGGADAATGVGGAHGSVEMFNSFTDQVVATVVGLAGQTADLMQWTGAGGGTFFAMSGDGALEGDDSAAAVSPANKGRLRYSAGGNERWETSENGGIYRGIRQLSLSYGANMTTAGRFLKSNGEVSSGQLAAVGPGTDFIVDRDVNLYKFGYDSASADATTDFRLWINGVALGGVIDATGARDVVDINVNVSEGDVVTVEYDAGTAPGFCHVTILGS